MSEVDFLIQSNCFRPSLARGSRGSTVLGSGLEPTLQVVLEDWSMVPLVEGTDLFLEHLTWVTFP